MAARNRAPAPERDIARDVAEALAWMKKTGTKTNREGMARYGIVSKSVFGISVAALRAHAKQLGKCHELALALWDTGHHEARLLAVFVAEPARCTPAQMDRWCRDFDNWATCDTACFALFDRTPHALAKVSAWAEREGEFQKRAAFALLAGLSVHDKSAPDAIFEQGLALIETAANDERNFVKKGVNWALRSIGKRNPALHRRAVAARWVGKDALRDLAKPSVAKRFARQKAARRPAQRR